ncbi:MAG: alpha/beta hydrolase [Anaerolineaceae bacterium]
MTSIQSQIMYIMMKNRHLLQGRLKQEAWDENTSIPEFRAMCEKSNSRLAEKPEGLDVSPVDAAGLPAEWLTPVGVENDGVILYMIGGGYISGSLKDHRSMVAKIVLGSQTRMLLFEHRLAPEHPYPAALDDAVSAYRWLLAQGISPEKICIVGESAGGGLCLATLLALRDQGIALPAAAVAMSPWTDLTMSGESYRTKAKVCLSPRGMAQVCSRYYVGNHEPRLPWISPLFGDLHGLPALYISIGDYETLLDDSTRFAAKAKDAGVDVTLRVGEKMVHCYPLMAPIFPEATQELANICQFIQKHLAN